MRVCIFQINSKYVHSSLAAWYLYSGVKKYAPSADASVLEGTVNEPIGVLLDRALSARCDVYCFPSYIWNIGVLEELVVQIKKELPSAITVMGGPEVSMRAADMLGRITMLDYVLSGEGEESLPGLIERLLLGGDICKVPGLSGRSEEGIFSNPPEYLKDQPPSPCVDEYFQSLNSRIAYIETSRGCPFRCAYCLSGGDKVRFFDIEEVKKNILLLANSGTKTVKFVDRTFNADRARAREIFSFIIESRKSEKIPEGVTFHFEIEGDLVDDDTLGLLSEAEAGLFQFEIGVQSFNQKTLEAIRRHTDLQRLCYVIKELSSYGNIHIHTDLIAGLPHEDIGSFKRSYNSLYSLGSHKIQIGFLKLLWGSYMRENPTLYPCEYESDAPYKIKSTPWLSEGDIAELEQVEWSNDTFVSSARFSYTIEYLLKNTEYTPYDLMLRLYEYVYTPSLSSLEEIYDRVYFSFSRYESIDAAVLRDVMIVDRLRSNNTCFIPHSLRVKDERMKCVSKKIDALYPKKPHVRRAGAILYTQGVAVWCDYDKKNVVSARYDIHQLPLSEMEKE